MPLALCISIRPFLGTVTKTGVSLLLNATTGSGSLPASPADSGVSDVESSTSSGGNEDANLLLKARLNPNTSLQPSLASHHSHLSSGKRVSSYQRQHRRSSSRFPRRGSDRTRRIALDDTETV